MLRYALCALFCVILAACSGEAVPTSTPPPTQALNPSAPTATQPVIIPTATLTPPPSAAEIARTAAAGGPTPDATEQVRQTQRALALAAASESLSIPASRLNIVAVTGVRAGRDIDGCGRARSGMALAYVLYQENVSELLVEAESATLCGTYNIYDERPDLLLLIDPIAEELVTLAKARVARTAAADASDVALSSVRPVTWPDASLGCDGSATPEAGITGGVAGYRIVLRLADSDFVYHTDFDRILPCVTG